MTSQLIVVDLQNPRNKHIYSELTHEHPRTITSHLVEELDDFDVHQYSYQAEYKSGIDLRLIFFWDGPYTEPREEGYEPTDLEKRCVKLCRQYEATINGQLSVVDHSRFRTVCTFRSDNSLPTTLDWIHKEPPSKEVV
ncbi:hypothetical protein [Pseudomonas phage ANB1]|nr:hypothetical protein [Pseudomonas phage ANB1]